IRRDSLGNFHSRRLLYGQPVALPYVMSFEEYARRHRRYVIDENWSEISRQVELEQSADEVLDFRVDVPGGEESVFSTIIGKTEVNLRINGTANVNIGASIRKTETPGIPADQQRQIDPIFDQSLQLNVQGTIGDKLSIGTDWNTERAFDFMNRGSVVYWGYED